MAHIQDRWFRADGSKSAQHGTDRRRWQARYTDPTGRERTRTFDRKIDAQRWLDEQKASVVTGRWIDPDARKVTVKEWAETWLDGYNRRPSTVKQARTHLAKIVEAFGPMPLGSLRPSQVRAWLSELEDDGYADSYRHALHSRLSQILTDAVHDRLIAENPCSRRTSPGTGETRQYVATTGQVWDLYDVWPERRRLAVLLGAFAGLRTAEVCGLKVADVAFLEREIRPVRQYPDKPLKSETAATPLPVPDTLLEAISMQVERWPAEWVLTDDDGGQLGTWYIDRDMRRVRDAVEGLPDGFRFHDLRHYYASLLISSGADVKVVQSRVRHASASTTLDTYGHMWPDQDETTRSAVEAEMNRRLTERGRNERDAR